MPPKKRTRDVDDEELDKEEVKGMLRQSLDERAELVVENEELKKKLDEHEKEKDRQLIEKVQLFVVDLPIDCKSRFVFYRNPHLLRQATAANMKSVLDLASGSGAPSGQNETMFVLKVDSCKELVQVFENGIPAGTELETGDHFDHKNALFSVAVITYANSSSTVAEGQQSTYLPVSARSAWWRCNYLLARHLERSAPFPRDAGFCQWTNLGGHLNNKDLKFYFSQEVQDAAQRAAYDAVIDNVWIPKSGEEDVALKHQLDLNKMLLIRGESSIEIGFWHGKLPNGATFQPGGRAAAL